MAARIKGGAAASGGAYTSAVLVDIDPTAGGATLSTQEAALRWNDNEVRAAANEPAAKKAASIRDKIVRSLGAG